jgi:quercetin dioxygenase-like cupin family protein
MLRITCSLPCALLLALASPALAQRAPDAKAPAATAPAKATPAAKAPADAAGYPAIPLLSTSTTILGEPLRYPTTGPAHVTASIVTLAPGQRTIPHKHGVPLFAYILDGEFSVDYGAKGVRTYKPGDSFMEAMDDVHFGFNAGSVPARLIAVYMGAKGAADVEPVK